MSRVFENAREGLNYDVYGGAVPNSMLYRIKQIEGLSKQTLTNQLRELESDGIIERKIYAEIPPKVEYTITPYGSTLLPIIDSMSKWARENSHFMPEKKLSLKK